MVASVRRSDQSAARKPACDVAGRYWFHHEAFKGGTEARALADCDRSANHGGGRSRAANACADRNDAGSQSPEMKNAPARTGLSPLLIRMHPRIPIDLPLFGELDHAHRGDERGVRHDRHFSAAFELPNWRVARPGGSFDAACDLAHTPHERAELNWQRNYQWRCANARPEVLLLLETVKKPSELTRCQHVATRPDGTSKR
jgi:hypothetical protein